MSNGKKSYGQIIILIVVVSLFFVPNSAFANGFFTPADMVMFSLFLISIVVVPIALVYLGIVSLKHFKPSWGNYIHSNRLIKIGFYFLAEGLSWVIFRAILSMSYSTWRPFGEIWIDYFMLLIIPGIILISIGVIKNRSSKTSRRTRIIFLIVGIGTVIFGGIINTGYITILGLILITLGMIISIYNKVKKKDYTKNSLNNPIR